MYHNQAFQGSDNTDAIELQQTDHITKTSASIFSLHFKTMNMRSPTAARKLFSYDASSTVSVATCQKQTQVLFLQVNIYEQLHTNSYRFKFFINLSKLYHLLVPAKVAPTLKLICRWLCSVPSELRDNLW